jgi:hypothetical protein
MQRIKIDERCSADDAAAADRFVRHAQQQIWMQQQQQQQMLRMAAVATRVDVVLQARLVQVTFQQQL